MNEIWKEIDGFENIYYISNLGNVLSFKKAKNGKIMRGTIDKDGYIQVGLTNKKGKKFKKKIHRLVAKAFISNPNDLPQVNHIDGNKLNNTVSNLEWCTNYENTIHAHRIGLCNNHYKKVAQYDLKGNFIKSYKTLREASLLLGKKKNDGAISMCCNRKIKTAYGFIWKFIN